MNCDIKQISNDKDISALESLAFEIWNQHFVPIIGQAQVDYMLERFQSFEAIKCQIAEGMNYLMLSVDGEDAGYCGFKADGERVFLSKLYLKIKFRGRGYSKLLLSYVKGYAQENELNSVYLTVNKHNYHTINIYKHIGFEIIDSVVSDIGNGFVMDDYILQLDL